MVQCWVLNDVRESLLINMYKYVSLKGDRRALSSHTGMLRFASGNIGDTTRIEFLRTPERHCADEGMFENPYDGRAAQDPESTQKIEK